MTGAYTLGPRGGVRIVQGGPLLNTHHHRLRANGRLWATVAVHHRHVQDDTAQFGVHAPPHPNRPDD